MLCVTSILKLYYPAAIASLIQILFKMQFLSTNTRWRHKLFYMLYDASLKNSLHTNSDSIKLCEAI